MNIMKQLIENMIFDYLEESYEDNLVESIYEEVSEETWDAIEEAILNELSPELLNRYKKKASKQLRKARNDRYMAGEKDRVNTANYIGDIQKGAMTPKKKDNYEKRKKEFETDYERSHTTAKKRNAGLMTLDRKSADFRNLSADEFEKKYNMKKSEWKRKNKYF